MSARRHLVPALQGLTLVTLSAAAALLAWPQRVEVIAAPPSLPLQVADAPMLPESSGTLTDSILDANIFSLSREAPEERTFVAAASDAVVDDVTSGEYGADAGLVDSTASSSPIADPVPSLYGVVNGPPGRAALLRLDANTGGARLFRLGEGTAGYRVRSIGADRVELSGPSGSVVLELVAKGGTP